MKKILISILTLAVIFSFAGCGNAKNDNKNNADTTTTFDEIKVDESTEAPTDKEEITAAPTEAPTEAPTKAPTEAPTQAPTAAPTEAPKNNNSVNPEFKATMDSYEKFFDEYVAFMKKYKSSNNPLSMMADYTKMMSKYTETYSKMSSIDENSLSSADYAYYMEVQSRITAKLAEVV